MADNEQVRDDQPDAAVDQRGGGARPGERVARYRVSIRATDFFLEVCYIYYHQ